MDEKTIAIYNAQAEAIAARHLAYGDSPSPLWSRLLSYFKAGEATADVGCGSGRDTHWLHQAGFPIVGYDGSEGMLAGARQRYPDGDFRSAFLPNLAEIPSAAYRNVLCSFVLMHLPKAELPIAIHNLARILKPEGRLLVAFRPSKAQSEREADGRLFTPISLSEMTEWMTAARLQILEAATHQDSDDPRFYRYFTVAERLP